MRTLMIAILVLLLPAPAMAADTYKCTLDDGSVEYSSKPCAEGRGEKVDLPTANTYESRDPVRSPPAADAAEDEEGDGEEALPEVRGYQKVTISSPVQDQVFNNTDTVSVSVSVSPALGKGQGVFLYLNGERVNEEPAGTAFTLDGLTRGTYTLRAEVVDVRGPVQARSEDIQFHLRRHSIINPP